MPPAADRDRRDDPDHMPRVAAGATPPAPPFADAVRAAIRSVPAGSVVTYGDVAELVGRGGPRQVARVLARGEGEDDAAPDDPLPWWRVLRADGTPAPHLAARQLAHLRAEQTALRPDGAAVDLRRARWDGTTGDHG